MNFIIAGIAVVSLLAIANVSLVLALIFERRRNEKRTDNLLNRVMAKDFNEYTANTRHLKKTESMGDGQSTDALEQYLDKFSDIEGVIDDLEKRGLLKPNTVPVV